ncbi:MAG TPA: tetratricopeptide repeat protein [Longimicrobiales bacterium]|nr:tetratricopeptide repeat protein [Longimicrobiales bacterium]
MKRFSIGRLWVAFALLGVAAIPASAQEAGERYIILVPDLAPQNGASDRFGKDVAKELRNLIEDLATHQTVTDKELNAARKKYNLDDKQLYNCVTARQLAMQMSWQLVLCADYTPSGDRQVDVNARFVAAQNAEEFQVPPFAANERQGKQAAQQILQSFDRWQNQLRLTLFCRQYLDSQQFDTALKNCNDALEINPRSGTALYQKAYALWKLDQDAEALTALDQLLELDPIKQDALKLAGIIATEMNERDRARAYFDRYMELNPGDVGVRLSIATDIANAGDPEGALRFAQLGLEVEPDNMNLITYIGHFAVNAAARAEVAIQEGKSVDPANVTEFYHTAAESYEKIFDAQGTETEPAILEKLIIALFKLQRYDEAVSLGQRATTAKPDNAAIWEAHSRALEESGKAAEALAALDRAASLGASSPALVQRKAILQLKQGNAAAGVATLQAAVQDGVIQPKDAFRIIFANAYQEKFQKGRLDEAYAMLDQAGALAQTEEDKLSRNFWRGYILFQQAQKAHEPMTAESARRAKPMFERALELFQASQGYEKIHASADVPRLIDAALRFIEIEEALIKRGR